MVFAFSTGLPGLEPLRPSRLCSFVNATSVDPVHANLHVNLHDHDHDHDYDYDYDYVPAPQSVKIAVARY